MELKYKIKYLKKHTFFSKNTKINIWFDVTHSLFKSYKVWIGTTESFSFFLIVILPPHSQTKCVFFIRFCCLCLSYLPWVLYKVVSLKNKRTCLYKINWVISFHLEFRTNFVLVFFFVESLLWLNNVRILQIIMAEVQNYAICIHVIDTPWLSVLF